MSPFKQKFPKIPEIKGLDLKVACSGMRYTKDDLLFVKFPKKANVAGIFTKSTLVGEPVKWCRKILQNGTAAALVVNSGYANVFCGEAGAKTVAVTVKKAAEILDCSENEIYVSSTGIIGQPISDNHLIGALETKLRDANFDQACTAINTTDTFNKAYYTQAKIGGETVNIVGVIKGSGMVEPNMATMLGFIFTDANIAAPVLQQLLNQVKDSTYNSITVDSDTSTSDMVLAFATGAAGNEQVIDKNSSDFTEFKQKFLEVNLELAKLVVKDGEGISKFIEINISGAENNDSARKIAKSVANSPLVKTAMAGEDANWGRIVAAIGKCGESVDENAIDIKLGDNLQPLKNSQLNLGYSESEAETYMKSSEIKITANVGAGDGKATVYTTDLTHEYISINADYRS